MSEQEREARGLLLDAVGSFLRGEHPSEGLGIIARAVAGATGSEAAVVLYRPHRRGEMILAGAHGLEREARRRALLPLIRELGGWVERTRGPAQVAGGRDPRFPSLAAAEVGAARAVPLELGDRILGALVTVGDASAPCDELAVGLAALGLRHQAWEEEARTAAAQRDEAERLRLRAERAVGVVEETGAMSREIRGAARAAVRVVERLGAVDDPELRAVRELLVEQLTRIDRVASQMVEAGEDRTSVPQPCDLGDLVEAALDRTEPALRAKRVRVSRRIGVSVPLLVLDPDLVRRVLMNLLNAVGDRVPAKGRLKVELVRRGGTAEVWVAADGPREAGDVIEALWAPFQSLDPSRGFSVASAHDFLRETGARLETRAEPDWPQSYRLHLPIADNRDRRAAGDRRRHRDRRRA